MTKPYGEGGYRPPVKNRPDRGEGDYTMHAEPMTADKQAHLEKALADGLARRAARKGKAGQNGQ